MRTIVAGVVALFTVIGVLTTVQILSGQSAAPLAGGAFWHVGIVVRDVEQTAKVFAALYGITPPPTRLYPATGNGAVFAPGRARK